MDKYVLPAWCRIHAGGGGKNINIGINMQRTWAWSDLGATAVSVDGKPDKINIGNGKPRA